MTTPTNTFQWQRPPWYMPGIEVAIIGLMLVGNFTWNAIFYSIDSRLFWPVLFAQAVINMRIHRWWIFSSNRAAMPGWRWL